MNSWYKLLNNLLCECMQLWMAKLLCIKIFKSTNKLYFYSCMVLIAECTCCSSYSRYALAYNQTK